MKIAVFSDVQGNLPALQAVIEDILAWRPDLTVLNGDLVNRGPLSRDCLLLFEHYRACHNWLPLKGNHEEYVLDCQAPAENALEGEMRRFAEWTLAQLGDEAERMRHWPDHLTLHGPDSDQWVHITHGSMIGNRVGISARIADADMVGRVPEGVDLLVTAHTHKVHQRRYGNTPILNIGSVGSPFDGDVRASYARLTFSRGRWQAQIRRLAYDREQAERDYYDSGFLPEGGPLARVIFAEWKRADLLMPLWKRAYLDAVLRGDIGLSAAVDEFLARG
ncbi:MAG: metallophosphoesterase [Gammaproteobacteria bacterium SHHR-1]|uniref:metallophosphoesterase family protein n=1 Tax=Magnetovirga frankeli TaxID=947516 RepID=UPI0012938BCA|nr:metallophosphoesterase [gamma proteobacterium SS-5]